MAKEIQVSGTNSSSTNGNLKNGHKSTKSMNGKNKLSSMSIEDQFNAAVNVIKNLPKNGEFQPSDQLKLKFYAYYKQALEGPNKTSKPSFFDVVNRFKWDAWSKLGNMSKEEAMKSYVNEIKQIIETMPYNESVSEFYDKLGPFFEFTDKSTKKVNGESKQPKLNGKQSTKDANFSSSSDSSDSDDFSDTVDSLSINGDSKFNLNSNENDYQNKDQNFENKNNFFEDCTDVNSKLELSDVIDAKGIDAGYLTGQESYFYDCIDKNSVLNPNDIICARGETGIFSSRISLPSNQDQAGSRSLRQPLNIDNNLRSTEGLSYYQSTGGNGGDRNYNTQNSELNDIHEHLALTVLRLQQTVKSISNRIENLENRVNERQNENSKRHVQKQKWWTNKTTQATVLLIIWPFAAHLIISAIKKKVKS